MGYIFGVLGGAGALQKNDNFFLAGNGTYQVNSGSLLQIISVLGGGLPAIAPDNTVYGVNDFAVPVNSGRLVRVNAQGAYISNPIGHDVTVTMSKYNGAVLVDANYVKVLARGTSFTPVDGGFTYVVTNVVNTPYAGQVRTPIDQNIQIGTAPGGSDVLPPTLCKGGQNTDITLNKTFDGGALLYITGITILTAFNVLYTNNNNSNPF